MDSPKISRQMTQVGPNPFREMETECSALFQMSFDLLFQHNSLTSLFSIIIRDTPTPIKFFLQQSLTYNKSFFLNALPQLYLNHTVKSPNPFLWSCSHFCCIAQHFMPWIKLCLSASVWLWWFHSLVSHVNNKPFRHS